MFSGAGAASLISVYNFQDMDCESSVMFEVTAETLSLYEIMAILPPATIVILYVCYFIINKKMQEDDTKNNNGSHAYEPINDKV